ncbi:hypothetical protein E2C01_063236 [Portunus trituberculatus]|uniref:Uncharacterized protein n=1 Tax=Portunus trituberculatus TaxID=210409 RepID=A0A5B7HFT3_PORTR|nr:hypothetical protein [Portunus trituberculatus]
MGNCWITLSLRFKFVHLSFTFLLLSYLFCLFRTRGRTLEFHCLGFLHQVQEINVRQNSCCVRDNLRRSDCVGAADVLENTLTYKNSVTRGQTDRLRQTDRQVLTSPPYLRSLSLVSSVSWNVLIRDSNQ